MAPLERSQMTFAWINIAVCVLAIALAALAGGCEETAGKAAAGTTPVKIKGKTFFLEVAADAQVRNKGLGDRKSIDDDGGMIFVFMKPDVLSFVMRDCPIPIDVIFTDGSGKILSMYAMVPEAPRSPEEGKPTDDPRVPGSGAMKYELRLKQYNSKYPAAFVVELQGGMIEKLGLKESDKIDFDAAGLKLKAR